MPSDVRRPEAPELITSLALAPTSRKLAAIMFTDIVGFSVAVGEDEAKGVRLRENHARLVKTLVEQFEGVCVEEVGDETLSSFDSAINAVNCALAVQGALEADLELSVRIGIHVGDVLDRDGTLVGEGVNLAARLRPLAEPGGICVSERVCDDVRNHPEIRATFLGATELKNIERPVRVYSLVRAATTLGEGRGRVQAGSRRARWLAVGGLLLAVLVAVVFYPPTRDALLFQLVTRGFVRPGPLYEQEIAFTRASDGVRIAYSTAGAGPPLVVVLGWFTHLEETTGPGWNVWAPRLVEDHRVVQYDGRGTGLSDRDVGDMSLEGRVRDLEAVVEAAGLDRFALYAISSGGSTAVSYAVRHPERVERIAFYGSFLRLDGVPGNLERWRSFPSMVRVGWGADNPAFRQLFTSLFMPDGSDLEMRVFNHMQKVAATPSDAARFIEALLEIDVRDRAPRVRAPVLVAHVRGDQIVPYGLGRELASLIPGARLVTFEGRNHMLFSADAAFDDLNETLAKFFAGGG